jgi:hypothetical protein
LQAFHAEICPNCGLTRRLPDRRRLLWIVAQKCRTVCSAPFLR